MFLLLIEECDNAIEVRFLNFRGTCGGEEKS